MELVRFLHIQKNFAKQNFFDVNGGDPAAGSPTATL